MAHRYLEGAKAQARASPSPDLLWPLKPTNLISRYRHLNRQATARPIDTGSGLAQIGIGVMDRQPDRRLARISPDHTMRRAGWEIDVVT